MSNSILEQLKNVLGNEVHTDFSYESMERIEFDKKLIEQELINKSPEAVQKFIVAFDLFLSKIEKTPNINSFRYNQDGINVFIPLKF